MSDWLACSESELASDDLSASAEQSFGEDAEMVCLAIAVLCRLKYEPVTQPSTPVEERQPPEQLCATPQCISLQRTEPVRRSDRKRTLCFDVSPHLDAYWSSVY